jgi:uncharacterized protein (DUF169 family)
MEGKWGRLTRQLEALLRLRSFPVGLKFLEDEAELERNRWVRRPDRQTTLCQLITIVRTFDWTIGITKDDINVHGANILGMAELPKDMEDGTTWTTVWDKTKEGGKRHEDSLAKIPQGRFRSLILAPLSYNPFDPDLILVFGNPAQIMLFMNAIQFESYESLGFSFVGECSGEDCIARCYLTKKPSLAIPCYGDRRYGHVQEEELEIAIPPEMLERVVHGLKELYKRGVRYPIPYYGAEADAMEGIVKVYPNYA